jgi:hypothetical protein
MATRQIARIVDPSTENLICIHALTGRAPKAKMCVHNHECATCPFDQMLEDMVPALPTRNVHARTAKAA